MTPALRDLYAVARAYERWEADLILDNDAWADRELPTITQPLWDRLMDIQAVRNDAIRKAEVTS